MKSSSSRPGGSSIRRLFRVLFSSCVGLALVLPTFGKQETHYDILEISESADEKEIKKAYRQLALRYHPDKNPGDAAAEQRFTQIAEAHEVLSDVDKRKMYDENELHASEDDNSMRRGGAFGRTGVPEGVPPLHIHSLEDWKKLDSAKSDNTIWVFHVYSRVRHAFGHWMRQMPPGMRLAHVNVYQCSQDVLNHFLKARRYPMFVVKYKGRTTQVYDN